MESFHEFYVTVEINYHKKFNQNDAKMFGNPLLDCEPETILDESNVKVEIHQFDTPASDYETVYVPSTSYWDGSNKQIDVLTDDGNVMPAESNHTSDAETTIKQEAAGQRIMPKRTTRDSKVQITKSTIRQQRNTVKTKSKLKKMDTEAIIDRRKKEFRKNARTVSEIV